MGFGEAFTAVRRHAPRFCVVAAACGASLASVPAQTTLAGRSEIFRGPEGMTGLLHPAATGAPRTGAVLIVHDALGMDTRGHRYIAQLTAAGLMVVEVELRANPADDSLPEPLPSEAEAAGLVARAAAELANDPRVDPNRVGALGFGIGARAVALAPSHEDGRHAFAARVLLYPACGSLKQLVQAPQHAAAPVLLLHGEDDPSNARRLRGGQVRRDLMGVDADAATLLAWLVERAEMGGHAPRAVGFRTVESVRAAPLHGDNRRTAQAQRSG